MSPELRAERTWPTAQASPCRCCGDQCFGADDEGSVHACCLAWRRVIAAGFPCPSCEIARIVKARIARGLSGLPPGDPPRLPRTLPDGSPFAPEVVVRPGRCAAPRSLSRLDVRCGEPAVLYPCGWRCPAHRPRPEAAHPTGGAA
jgi:hypothetical protein